MNTEQIDQRLVVAFGMEESLAGAVFGPDHRARLGERVDLVPGYLPQDPARLAEVDVLLSGWGCPAVDAQVLTAMPRLRAVLHSAGTLRKIATPEAFDRGVAFSSVAWANAIPVAEYTLAAVIFALKGVFTAATDYRRERRMGMPQDYPERVGAYGATVGIVGASQIGRRAIDLLGSLDVQIVLYDPTLTEGYGTARLVDLDELLRTSHVVSLHAPSLPQTARMIDARALSLMRDGATLINTARGALVDEGALLAELKSGRLNAVLDVTDPEPVSAQLAAAPRLFLTPHLAGSYGNELLRLGAAVESELTRLVRGEPLQHEVDAEQFRLRA